MRDGYMLVKCELAVFKATKVADRRSPGLFRLSRRDGHTHHQTTLC